MKVWVVEKKSCSIPSEFIRAGHSREDELCCPEKTGQQKENDSQCPVWFSRLGMVGKSRCATQK